MDAMNIHGIHGYPRNPCISMDSMNFHGIHDIHGIHGYPWNQWISIESIDHQMPVHVNVGTCAQISGHMCPEIWAHVPKVCPEIWAHHQVSQIPKQKWAQYKLGYRVRTCTGPSGVLYGPVQYPAMGCKTASGGPAWGMAGMEIHECERNSSILIANECINLQIHI
jgi:hypothetical protein